MIHIRAPFQLGNIALDSLVKLSVGSFKGVIFIMAVDHRRRTKFGVFHPETVAFEELLDPHYMEDVDHKFHAAQLYFVQKSDLLPK